MIPHAVGSLSVKVHRGPMTTADDVVGRLSPRRSVKRAGRLHTATMRAKEWLRLQPAPLSVLSSTFPWHNGHLLLLPITGVAGDGLSAAANRADRLYERALVPWSNVRRHVLTSASRSRHYSGMSRFHDAVVARRNLPSRELRKKRDDVTAFFEPHAPKAVRRGSAQDVCGAGYP